MAAMVGDPMRPTIRPTAARLGQCTHIPPIGIHPPCAMAVHPAVIGIGHDYVVPELYQVTRHPLALRRSLDQDPGPTMGAERSLKPSTLRADSLLNQLPVRRDDANLA